MNENKYYIFRESEHTGRIEILRTKCTDEWCDKRYLEIYPDRVWKFSKSGAKKIIDRQTSRGWHFKYWMEKA